MKLFAIVLLALVSTVALAADNKSDEQALLELHSKAREAHLKGDANLLAEGVADRFMDVGRGHFDWTTREQFRERFTKVFATTEYSSWENAVPAVVHIAPGGKTGWMAVQLKAELTTHQDGKPPEKLNFGMAWIANYEKQNGKWLMTAIAYSAPAGK